jgi:LysM repeat protein
MSVEALTRGVTATAAREPVQGGGYTVSRGDTLSGIARRLGVSQEAMEAANPQLANPNRIFPGQQLNVPGGAGGTHVVARGDTVSDIARQHGVSLDALARANGLRNANLIFPGQRLEIPSATARVEAPAARPAAPTPAPAGDRPAAPATEASPARPADLQGTANLRSWFDPARGSSAPGAIIIGQAEGTRTPSGGFRDGYYGHVDPGNGVGNRGSFSLQNAGNLTPEQADARQLERLSAQLPTFTEAARGAGIDPNNVQLSTAYLDLYNQSPTAAARFLDQIGYLNEAGVSTASLTELRFRSFVDVSTGERFRLASGTPAGGGFANIARDRLGRTPTETEVQDVIRADQSRRLRAMEGALPNIEAAAPATPAPATDATPATPATPEANAPAQTPRFTMNAGLDLPASTIAQANGLHDRVLAETGTGIHVTSGRRDPGRQASAMYANLADGSSPSYANRAAFAEIRAAYDSGRAEGLSRADTIARMTDVIQAQVDRGVFISRHLSSRAIDIRTPSAAVLEAIRSDPSVQSVLREDDHIHIQFD